jgi:hypothetical protein
MNLAVLYFLAGFLAPPQQSREERARELIHEIAVSGRMIEAGDRQARLADARRLLAPGLPPLLSFRYFEGADRGRYGKLNLMLDDAGH